MDKYEFLYKLGKQMETQSPQEKKEVLGYYEELIQDAIDSGEPEAAFIDRLGSVEKIVRTLKKDQGFVENVKKKQNYQLQNIFSSSVKIVGYGLYFVAVFILGSIVFSLFSAGLSLVFFAALRVVMIFTGGFELTNVLMFAGLILLGLGLLMLGWWLVRWILKESKGKLEKLFEAIQALFKKEGN